MPAVIPAAPPQTAAIATPRPAPPPPRPAPTISAAYRGALAAWLNAHKRYPESARQRSEEGRAVLRFRVGRDGRVLDYAIVSGTGHADLDAALDRMMRGAAMPPFPADMTASEIEVTLTIRFGLSQ
jgi:protein TonB